MARRRRPNRTETNARTQLAAYPGRVELPVLESMAAAAWARALLCAALADPLFLVQRHGVEHRPGVVQGCAGALLRKTRRKTYQIVYRIQRRRAQGLAVLHEFAHWLLLTRPHDDRDVWLLTLMLAMPADDAWHYCAGRREGWSLRTLARRQRHVESWALDLRLDMLRPERRKRRAA